MQRETLRLMDEDDLVGFNKAGEELLDKAVRGLAVCPTHWKPSMPALHFMIVTPPWKNY